jgi:hypothetical protein
MKGGCLRSISFSIRASADSRHCAAFIVTLVISVIDIITSSVSNHLNSTVLPAKSTLNSYSSLQCIIFRVQGNTRKGTNISPFDDKLSALFSSIFTTVS